jgi:cobalt/nickel transport protein
MNKKIVAVILPAVVVFFASLFASKQSDTLETLAINYGFDGQAKEISSIFTGYSFPFINDVFLSTFLAGVTGLFLLYILFKIINTATKHFLK